MSFVKYNKKKYEIKDNYLDLKSQGIKDITLIEGLETLTNLEALNLRSINFIFMSMPISIVPS